MKILIVSALALMSSAAFADIDATNSIQVSRAAQKPIVLTFETDSAAQIFDALNAPAIPGWEDQMTLNKSAAGIYCYSQSAAVRFAQCIVQIDSKDGIKDAIATGRGERAAISFGGDAAKNLYNLLEVSERQADRDGMAFLKYVRGINCQRFDGTNETSCLISLDTTDGILR